MDEEGGSHMQGKVGHLCIPVMVCCCAVVQVVDQEGESHLQGKVFHMQGKVCCEAPTLPQLS